MAALSAIPGVQKWSSERNGEFGVLLWGLSHLCIVTIIKGEVIPELGQRPA